MKDFYGASAVQYGNTFLVAGGKNEPFDAIYRYDPGTGDWEEMPQKLPTNEFRGGHSLMMVPDSFLGCGPCVGP